MWSIERLLRGYQPIFNTLLLGVICVINVFFFFLISCTLLKIIIDKYRRQNVVFICAKDHDYDIPYGKQGEMDRFDRNRRWSDNFKNLLTLLF